MHTYGILGRINSFEETEHIDDGTVAFEENTSVKAMRFSKRLKSLVHELRRLNVTILDAPVVIADDTSTFNVHQQVNARLAKVQKDFTCTLLVSEEKMLLVNESHGVKRQCTKGPKKYVDFDDTDENVVSVASPSLEGQTMTVAAPAAPSLTVIDMVQPCSGRLRRMTDVKNPETFSPTDQPFFFGEDSFVFDEDLWDAKFFGLGMETSSQFSVEFPLDAAKEDKNQEVNTNPEPKIVSELEPNDQQFFFGEDPSEGQPMDIEEDSWDATLAAFNMETRSSYSFEFPLDAAKEDMDQEVITNPEPKIVSELEPNDQQFFGEDPSEGQPVVIEKDSWDATFFGSQMDTSSPYSFEFPWDAAKEETDQEVITNPEPNIDSELEPKSDPTTKSEVQHIDISSEEMVEIKQDLDQQQQLMVIPIPIEGFVCLGRWKDFLAAFQSQEIYIWVVQMENHVLMAVTTLDMPPSVCEAMSVVNIRYAINQDELPLLAVQLLRSGWQNDNANKHVVGMQGMPGYWQIKPLEGNLCDIARSQNSPFLLIKVEQVEEMLPTSTLGHLPTPEESPQVEDISSDTEQKSQTDFLIDLDAYISYKSICDQILSESTKINKKGSMEELCPTIEIIDSDDEELVEILEKPTANNANMDNQKTEEAVVSPLSLSQDVPAEELPKNDKPVITSIEYLTPQIQLTDNLVDTIAPQVQITADLLDTSSSLHPPPAKIKRSSLIESLYEFLNCGKTTTIGDLRITNLDFVDNNNNQNGVSIGSAGSETVPLPKHAAMPMTNDAALEKPVDEIKTYHNIPDQGFTNPENAIEMIKEAPEMLEPELESSYTEAKIHTEELQSSKKVADKKEPQSNKKVNIFFVKPKPKTKSNVKVKNVTEKRKLKNNDTGIERTLSGIFKVPTTNTFTAQKIPDPELRIVNDKHKPNSNKEVARVSDNERAMIGIKRAISGIFKMPTTTTFVAQNIPAGRIRLLPRELVPPNSAPGSQPQQPPVIPRKVWTVYPKSEIPVNSQLMQKQTKYLVAKPVPTTTMPAIGEASSSLDIKNTRGVRLDQAAASTLANIQKTQNNLPIFGFIQAIGLAPLAARCLPNSTNIIVQVPNVASLLFESLAEANSFLNKHFASSPENPAEWKFSPWK